jgi:hypothetical protein
VTVGQWIEAAGVERGDHWYLKKVSRVAP